MNLLDWWPLGAAVLAGAVGYGELKQKVASTDAKVTAEAVAREQMLSLVRNDIKRVDEKIEHLTDFLLRQAGKL